MSASRETPRPFGSARLRDVDRAAGRVDAKTESGKLSIPEDGMNWMASNRSRRSEGQLRWNHTLRSRNSRSHELMTWRNARSSHSFTAFQAPTNGSPSTLVRGAELRSVRSDSARLSGSS